MNFAELQSEVYTITNRPDRIAETSLAVRQATLKIHQSDYYWKDLQETGIYFATGEFIQELDYRALFPLWRSLKYLRKSDAAGLMGDFLEVIQPESVLDSYSQNKVNVCYAAGGMINIKSSTETQYYFLGCYLNPNVTAVGYSSWVADDHPFAIILEAAANVFRQIGKTEEFAVYNTLAMEQLVEVKMSNIQAVGY